MKAQRLMLLGLVALAATALCTMLVGRYSADFYTVLQIFKLHLCRSPIPEDLVNADIVIWSVRLPRLLMAAMVGASLSASGAVLQGIFRNPLVSPDILGVSSGASFGAGLAILLLGTSTLAVSFFAFVGGLVAVTLAYQIGRRGQNTITTMVLAGVIVSALFSAALSFLKYVADPYEQLPAIVFWTMGGFNNIDWGDLSRSFPLMIGGLLLLYLFRWRLNLMALGEEEAMGLGVNVKRALPVFVALATLVVAASISACGTIGWVGLVVPHMARIMIGPDHKHLLPFSMIVGAVFMLLMDTLARSITGAEIPISIMTSLLGAPFLGYLLLREQDKEWNS